MANLTEILGNRLIKQEKMRCESINNELLKRIRQYTSATNGKKSEMPTISKIKNDRVLELIKKEKYEEAVELAKLRKLNPFSLFNGVQAFGKTYDNIPFIAAALAVAVDKRSKKESPTTKVKKVLSEVFGKSGVAKNMFDAKFNTPSGSSDILTFILTRDGSTKHGKYSQDMDLDAMSLLSFVLNGGYSIENISSLIKYVFENDLISTLRFLIENDMYVPDISSIETYGIKPLSNIGRLISTIAPHPFKLHAPEIEFDDKGKFAGGTLYDSFKRIGYDISNVNENDKFQELHPSFIWMIKDAILNAYVNYCNNGENITNASDICFGDGTDFSKSIEQLLYLCSEYRKYLKASDGFKEDDRLRYIKEMVKSVNLRLNELQNGFNTILCFLNLPKVTFVLKNQLKGDEKDIAYKVITFMKEIWDSFKSGRKHTHQ